MRCSFWLYIIYKYLYKTFSIVWFSFFCLVFSTVFDSSNKDFRILGVSNHLNSPLSSGVVEIILILANPPFFTTMLLSIRVIPFTLVLFVTDLLGLPLLRCCEMISSIIFVRYGSCPTIEYG